MKKVYQKHKSFVSIFIAIMMIFQLILPVLTSSVYAEENTENSTESVVADELQTKSASSKGIKPLAGEGSDLGSGIFNDVKVEYPDGTKLESGSVTEVEITDGLQLKVTFGWEIGDEVDLKEGDWAEFQLPVNLSRVGVSTSGELQDSEGKVVGTYELTSDGKLRVVFNGELENLENRKGEVGFLLKFDVKDFKDDAIQKIEFGESINKKFSFKAKPTGEVHDIHKRGEADAKINPSYIEWTVDVNTKLESLTNGSVEDVIPAGLVLDESSIQIYELTVGSEGKLTQGIQVTKSLSTDGGVLKVDFGETDKAYRIIYKTKIEGDIEESYTNKAILYDNGTKKAEDEITVDGLSKGSLIEKVGEVNSGNPDQITWTIYVNKAEENLNNVQILDTIPDGLNVERIDYWKSDAKGNYGEWVGTSTEFPLDLGDITGAYIIRVKTNIDYSYFENYTKDYEFINTVKLEVNGEIIDESSAKVPIDRGTLLEKSGEETTSYGDSKITWTLKVNKAKQTIANAIITDTVGDGLELIDDSITVYNETTKTELTTSDYTFVKNADGTFTISLGDIKDEFTIKYDTKIIAPLEDGQEGYSNKGKLSGGNGLGGVGTGDLEKEVIVKPTVKNIYSKQAATGNEKVDGVTYDGLNYADKTMSWKVVVDALKEQITELKIEDSFDPAKTMKLIPETLKIVVNDDTVPLQEGVDYTLTDNGVDGFAIEFIGDHQPLKRAQYKIYYKTDFDADNVTEAGGKINDKQVYTNKVDFKGTTKDSFGKEHNLDETREGQYRVSDVYFNEGKKEGDINRENRTITWSIRANFQGRNLKGAPFVITDKLTQGNQTVIKDSVKVNKLTLNKKSGDSIGEEINPSEYEIAYDDDEKGFKITFADGVDGPIFVTYQSQINGISEKWYKNEAVITDKNSPDKKYDATVEYKDHDKFVDKQALNADGNKVYTDDALEWEVKLNESLSTIQNAVFNDEISDGLVLLKDSIKLYVEDKDGKETESSLQEGNVSVVKNADGTTSLTINISDNLGDAVTGRLRITYTTVVVGNGVKVSNKASLIGDGDQLGNSSTKEFDAKQSSWGTGTGNLRKGEIIVTKVDKDNQTPLEGVKFQLYYELEGEKRLIGDERTTDADGKITYGELPFRQYYLEEVEPLEGYKKIEPIKVDLNKTNRLETVRVENERIPEKNYAIGDYTWVDTNKDGIQDSDEPILEGVIVELYDKDGNKLAETTTDGNGKYIFDELDAGEYKVKFTLTEDQAKIYEFTKQ
ncbi:MAG: hypothetical protein GX083_04630, partial [Clostridiales bacterium]|nr:hypothetical protein [Clostridiales bacterium]